MYMLQQRTEVLELKTLKGTEAEDSVLKALELRESDSVIFLYRKRKKKINIIRASEYNAISSSVHSMNRSRMRLTDCMISIIITATTSSGANRL